MVVRLYCNYSIESFYESFVTTVKAVQKNTVLIKKSTNGTICNSVEHNLALLNLFRVAIHCHTSLMSKCGKNKAVAYEGDTPVCH